MISLAVPFALGAVSAWSAPANLKQSERYENLETFQKVLHFVETNYVEEVKNKDLINGAIKGMLETLDPHSNFLSPEIFKDMKIETSGKFGGLGIEIGLKDNVLTVIAPIEDTPAWNAGLKPGDRIVKINDESTKGLTLVEAVSKMRGKKGTEVKLAIFRDGFSKIKDVKIVRDIIKIQSVKFEPVEKGYGYVRLTNFNETAAQDIKKAVEQMEKKEKLQGLVLDLRTNPGGLLDQAVDVSSLFLDEGVIVSTVGRNKDQKDVKHAKRGMARHDLPLAVLVNSSSASAAEIVAGALQDHNRAVIMGQPTFGKGSVQTVIDLGSEMGLKLTIARYYTPSGRSIQEKGVQPDIVLDDFDPKRLAEAKRNTDGMRERDLKGHMVNTDEQVSGGEYRKEDLELIGKNKKAGTGGQDSKASKGVKPGDESSEEMTPTRMDPKDDYQVRQAVNYLKSYEVFKKIGLKTVSAESAAIKPIADKTTDSKKSQ